MAESDLELAAVSTPTALREIRLNGTLLVRGFWLYVWEVTPPKGERVLYVGRTGDHASGVSQSPFNRFSSHLGVNRNANALRRHLSWRGLNLEACDYRFVAYGPVPVPCGLEHGDKCDIMHSLERALAEGLRAAGYDVLNTVKCRKPLDVSLWADVQAAFAQDFPAVLRARSG